MAHKNYGMDALHALEEEARRRKKEEKARAAEAARLEAKRQYEVEKEARHREWILHGQLYYDTMCAEEKQREEAAEYKRLQAIEKKRAFEAEKRRVAEAYAERMRLAREAEEARLAEIERRTRWYDDGSRYVGDFLEDGKPKRDRREKHRTPHGQGVFYKGVDPLYDGEWFFGERHGFGRLVCPDGSIYTGRFLHGARHGKGIWEKMTAEAIVAKAEAEDIASREAYTVTEVFTSPPRTCIFWDDEFVCWWDELIPGVTLRICLENSYNSNSFSLQWFHCVIVEVRPDPDDDDYGGGGGSGGDGKKHGSNDSGSDGDERKEGKDGVAATTPRIRKRPVDRKLHCVQCFEEKPWRLPRWVNLAKMRFKMAAGGTAQGSLCHLPEVGLQVQPPMKGHLGSLETISDPLSEAFKMHIKYKLETRTRAGMVGREVPGGQRGSAGSPNNGFYRDRMKSGVPLL